MADINAVRELTQKLETGVKELFESGKYAEYLNTMSRFHNYSARNIMLIHMQNPDATRVASYNAWKKKFNRQVKKGEHGLKIVAPSAGKTTREIVKIDPLTQNPIIGEDGEPVREEVEATTARFVAVNVFDVSQTAGEPLPVLAENLPGDVANYGLFMDSLRGVSPLPIVFEPMDENMDGLCRFGDRIALRDGMSEIQTVSAAIHEITHAKLHDIEILWLADANAMPKDRRLEETEAESVAYVVSQYYGIDTSANSFGYLAEWSRGRELKELNASLETIRKTAAELIDGIDDRYRALAKGRGIDSSVDAHEPSTGSLYAKYCNIIAERAAQYAVSSATLLLTDETEARRACDQIVSRVINDLLLEPGGGEHYPLYSQYMDDPDFKARLEDYAFMKAYLEPKTVERQRSNQLVEATAETPIEQKRQNSAEKPEVSNEVEYSELQQKGFEIAKRHENSPLQARLNIIAQTFGCETAKVATVPCTGKYRGDSDIMLRLDNGESLWIGIYRTAQAKSAKTINEAVNNTLARYNPEIVSEIKERAAAALSKREPEDNAIAAEKGLKPYTFLNVELNDGSYEESGGYLGWYYVTLAVDGRLLAFIETGLNYDIARGVLSGQASRPDYFVAGGLHDKEVDFVFNNVGHCSYNGSNQIRLAGNSRLRAENRLKELSKAQKPHELPATKPEVNNKLENDFYEAFPDYESAKTAFLGEYYDLPVEFEIVDDVKNISYGATPKTLSASIEANNGRHDWQYDNDRKSWEYDGFVDAMGVRGDGYEPDADTLRKSAEHKAAGLDLSLPDPLTTAADCEEYGYSYDGMLPMSNLRALELFDTNHCIYLLYPDNTESMAFDREEIKNHEGLCGIEREDWERSPVFAAQKSIAVNIEGRRESELLHGDGNRFGIYQIRDGINNARDFRFAPMRELEAQNLSPSRSNYELVYTAPFSERIEFLSDRYPVLNRIYQEFNANHPADYAARSVSVSDVIVLKSGGDISSHYVDGKGFVELDGFLGEESHREAAKREAERTDTALMQTKSAVLTEAERFENDYIADFTVSSPPMPTVAQLEAGVNAGKVISITDLAKAVQAERKPPPNGKPSLLGALERNKQKVARQGQPETHKKDGLEV